MPDSKKKYLLWLMVMMTLGLLILLWQIYLKNFPTEEKEESSLFENLEESFKIFSNKIKNFKLPQLQRMMENVMVEDINNREEKPREPEKNKMTNQEIEKLKEKVLEYINKAKQE